MGRRRKPPVPRAPLVAQTLMPSHALDAREYASEAVGELELEVIRRLLERQEPKDICRDVGLAASDLDALFQLPRFQREFELQTKLADRGIRVRMERLAGEALDVVRDVMRTAVSPGNRLRAAIEILDRSGYVKVEKRLTVTADAESIIRELNRLGAAGPTTDDPVTVPHPASPEQPSAAEEEIEDAEFSEIARTVAESDFGEVPVGGD